MHPLIMDGGLLLRCTVLYIFNNIINVFEMGEASGANGEGRGFWWGNLRERDYGGDPGVDGRIILRWIFRKWDVGVWTGSSWLRIGTVGGHL